MIAYPPEQWDSDEWSPPPTEQEMDRAYYQWHEELLRGEHDDWLDAVYEDIERGGDK